MPGSKDFKSNKKYIFLIIYILCLILSISYGKDKQGFHEDEYYTYYSSNRSIGLFQPDREWQDRQQILDEFTVKKGEGFNFGLVKLVQSWDVHPPFYYFLFHTACSLVPGVFTKWTGIITNLLAFTIAFVFLCLLMEKLRLPKWVEVLTLVFWGMNAQTVSANIFIRMYAWLGAAIFACAYFHVKLIDEYDDKSLDAKELILKGFLPIMAVSYIGFLIQYFYIFFFFFIGVATTAVIVFVKKDLKNGLLYVGSCALSLILAVLTYPAALSHMFGGYRGSEAAGSFLDPVNTLTRVSFFVGLLNDFVFAGGLWIIVVSLLVGIMVKYTVKSSKQTKGARPEVIVLAVGAIGYFLAASKTALLVGSASNRYEMPIYGLLILLIFMDADYIFGALQGRFLIIIFAVLCVVLLFKGHEPDRRVLFLYQEDKDKIAYAADNSDETAIVMFNPATPQNVWRLTDELLQYPRVYYMDEENLDALTDPEITGADKIILYAADDDLQQEAFDNLLSSCPRLTTITPVSTEDMWKTYEVK